MMTNKTGNNIFTAALAQTWGIPLLIFLLALAVRLPGLGVFLTVDEPTWLERSRWFLSGLTSQQECPPAEQGRAVAARGLACTLQSTHPGVTTMWSGSLGLLARYWQSARPAGVDLPTYLQTSALYATDPQLIAATRLPVVIVSALFVLFFYILVRRLLAEPVAIAAALLLALNPFHIALSRILHHDALVTTFMTLSALAMIGYWLRGWSRGWLLVSGGLGGLAVLTKAVGWFLGPYLVLLGIFYAVHRWMTHRRPIKLTVRQLALDGLLWSAAAAASATLFFPALWVAPVLVIQTLFTQTTDLALDGHLHFFLGSITYDPGPLFYPVVWLFSTSPLELLGLAALAVAAVIAGRRQWATSIRRWLINHPVEIALILFVVAMFIFETTSPKKMPRYLLPIFPAVDILAAAGLLWLANKLARRWALPLLCAVILAGQGWLVVSSYPYYFTYFNPLLGGAPAAGKIMDFSWGEGMNEAAAYFNELPNAQNLTITTCYANTMFEPYFVGKTILPCASFEQITQADYVVYYLWDRLMKGNANYWPFFRDHYAPVHRITIAGVDYALIYRNPIQHPVAPAANRQEKTLAAYGFNLNDGQLSLYWHNLSETQPPVQIGLTPLAGGAIRWAACAPAPGFETDAETPGAFVASVCNLAAANAPAGLYDLKLGLNAAPVAPSGLALVAVHPDGQIELQDTAAALDAAAQNSLPANASPLQVAYGSALRLVGYQIGTAELTLYWQPVSSPDPGLVQAFQLDVQAAGGSQPAPIFPPQLAIGAIARGAIVPVTYPLPANSANSGAVAICLKITGSGQIIPAQTGQTAADCLQLPANPQLH